jgi:hypothetical protein
VQPSKEQILTTQVGSLARRLPDGQPIIWSQSRCEGCGAVLTARVDVRLNVYGFRTDDLRALATP